MPTRHVLTTAAAQNYGPQHLPHPPAVRLRGPHRHDQARRRLDQQRPRRLAGDRRSRRSLARAELRLGGARFRAANGFEIEFSGGLVQQQADARVRSLHLPRLRADRAARVVRLRDAARHDRARSLNHVEIYLTAHRIEVWASEASPDGAAFPISSASRGATSTCRSRAAT